MDDLEARLDELSRAGEPRGADVIWQRARRKLRRRRMVRVGALATTAVLLVAVIGVVVNNNRSSDVAAPPDPTTTATTPKPIGTEGRLASTILLPSGRLDPPEPSDIPKISAFDALRPTTPRADLPYLDLLKTRPGVPPEVRLARCAACARPPLTSPLVWAVIFNDIASPTAGGPTGPSGLTGPTGAPPPNGPTGGSPPSNRGVMIWVVDALTGAGGEGSGFAPPLSASQLACQDGCTPIIAPTPTPPADEVLTQSGGCADAFFWAANPEQTVAVTVTVEARDRSATAPTVIDFTLPDPKVKVEIQRGRGLVQSFCNDVIDGNSYWVDSHKGADKAAGRITLGPQSTEPFQCTRGVTGTLHLDDDVVADDGTRIAVPDIVTQSIGCYAG